MIEIFLHTPWWVWIILAYIIMVGLSACKSRQIFIPTLFIFPVIASFLKLFFYGLNYSETITTYFISFCITFILCITFIQQQMVKIVQNSMSLQVPGNPLTLIVLLSFFCVRYYFGYLQDSGQEMSPLLISIDEISKGVLTGYFWAMAIGYSIKYRKNKNK